jgi:hypothetical protein
LAITGSGWDPELLRLELGELKLTGFDLTLTGFDDIELGFALARARSSPARMRISSRSNSAHPPRTVSIKRPCAVVVSAHASPSRIRQTSLAAAAQSIEKGSGLRQLPFIIRGGGRVPTISHCHKGNLDLRDG